MPTDGTGNSRSSRRLAAILAADIAGYSALMGANEESTVCDLKAHQAVVLPLIAKQGVIAMRKPSPTGRRRGAAPYVGTFALAQDTFVGSGAVSTGTQPSGGASRWASLPYYGTPGLGWHFVQAVEFCNNANQPVYSMACKAI